MEVLYIAPGNDVIPNFATIMVHEVRNPLTSIKLFVRIIAAKTKDDDIQKYLDIISKSSQKTDDLLTALLKPAVVNRDFSETISLHALL